MCGDGILIEKIIKLTSSDGFNALKLLFEFASYVVTILGIAAVAAAWVQYLIEKKNRKEDNDFHKTELTVELLDKFANEIIPNINEHYKAVEAEFEGMDLEGIEEEKFKQILINVKMQHDIVRIFNSFEHISVYIKTDIVHTDLLFDPISNVVILFVESNIEVFDELLLRTPFTNLRYVLDTWTKEKQLKFLENQKKQIEAQEREIKNK